MPLLRNMAGILDPLYGLTDGYFALYLLLQFLLSFAMMAVPTFLMGASLPLLIVAVSEEAAFRRSVALLYGINTLGAAAGTLAAGLVLLPVLGISDTVWVAVAAGVLVAAGGYLLDLRLGPRDAAGQDPGPVAGAAGTPRLLLAAVAMAGCLGLFYQIAWTRLLIPVVGSSVYAFTIILTTVLLGIGAGSLLAAVPSFRESSCWRSVAVTVGVGSCSVLAGLFAVNELPAMFTAMARGTGGPHLAPLPLPGGAGGFHRPRPGLRHGGRPAPGHRRLAERGGIEGAGRWGACTPPTPRGPSPARCWPVSSCCRGSAPPR